MWGWWGGGYSDQMHKAVLMTLQPQHPSCWVLVYHLVWYDYWDTTRSTGVAAGRLHGGCWAAAWSLPLVTH